MARNNNDRIWITYQQIEPVPLLARSEYASISSCNSSVDAKMYIGALSKRSMHEEKDHVAST